MAVIGKVVLHHGVACVDAPDSFRGFKITRQPISKRQVLPFARRRPDVGGDVFQKRDCRVVISGKGQRKAKIATDGDVIRAAHKGFSVVNLCRLMIAGMIARHAHPVEGGDVGRIQLRELFEGLESRLWLIKVKERARQCLKGTGMAGFNFQHSVERFDRFGIGVGGTQGDAKFEQRFRSLGRAIMGALINIGCRNQISTGTGGCGNTEQGVDRGCFRHLWVRRRVVPGFVRCAGRHKKDKANWPKLHGLAQPEKAFFQPRHIGARVTPAPLLNGKRPC